MIQPLSNKDIAVATQIRSVFQASYTIEAKLLNATNFPPLKRSLENFMTCNNLFYGYAKGDDLAGVIEIDHSSTVTNINSLVVDPRFFRQGIAGKLIAFVFDTFESPLFVVETGVDNKPATDLYRKYGFKEVKQWDTVYGIRKVRFERIKEGCY